MGPPRDSEQTAGHPSLFRASSPACSSPRHGTPPSFTPDFSRHGPLPQYRGTSRGVQSAAPHLLPILLKKARWGEDGGLGGKEGPCAPAKGPSFPPKPATSAPLPALAKAATDFYTHALAGRPHGIRPCPAARGRKRPSWRESARSSLLRSRSHANRGTLSTRLSGPVFHYLTAPAEQQRIL